MRTSTRRITPFYVMEVMERAAELERAGRDIVHLEIGEPDFQTPQCVADAAVRAIRDGKTHYTHSLGIIELREAIAEHYGTTYGIEVDPGSVIVTSGSSPAMLLAFSALLDRGDIVLLTDPHYACYPNFLYHLDVEPRFLPVRAETAFQFDADQVRRSLDRKVRAILVNSPANPTGTVIDPDTLEELAGLGPTIVSDEIYHGLVYGSVRARSSLEFSSDSIVIGGFSKLYAMTGWRLGYLIVPSDHVRAVQSLQQNFFISPNAFVQWAGIAALREAHDDVARMTAEFSRRRDVMLEGLQRAGLDVPAEPQGAFYVWVNVRRLSSDSLALANTLLDETGVAVTPGMDFGREGEGYLRLSYATSIEKISEGISRLETFMSAR